MSVCDDFIIFDESDDWEQIINLTFTATNLGVNSYTSIGEQDLGVTLTESYLVIVAQPFEPKSNWKYGGEIRQTWSFSLGEQVASQFAVAQSEPTQLFINKPQVITTPKNSVDGYKLRYSPPSWFKQVTVIVWKYIGEVQNFTRDTLENISNALDANNSSNNELINTRIEDLLTNVATISERLTSIENTIASNIVPEESIQSTIAEETSQINEQINLLSNNLADVLGGEESADILYQDNLDEEL